MHIRQAGEEDLKTVQHITYETIQTVYPHYYPKGAVDFFMAHHSEENILQDISLGNVVLLEEKEVVGTMTIKGNEICRLFVVPKEQRKGYGKLLLEYGEHQIGKQFSKVQLDASFAAKEMYLKRGYETIASHAILTENGDYLCYDVMEKGCNVPKHGINYDGRIFIPKLNSTNGEVDEKTTFNYHQEQDILWAQYTGGDIERGHIIGTVSEHGVLDFYYQHLNKQGEVRIGKCQSTPCILENGKIELHEQWQWLNGDQSTGSSVIIEK